MLTLLPFRINSLITFSDLLILWGLNWFGLGDIITFHMGAMFCAYSRSRCPPVARTGHARPAQGQRRDPGAEDAAEAEPAEAEPDPAHTRGAEHPADGRPPLHCA